MGDWVESGAIRDIELADYQCRISLQQNTLYSLSPAARTFRELEREVLIRSNGGLGPEVGSSAGAPNSAAVQYAGVPSPTDPKYPHLLGTSLAQGDPYRARFARRYFWRPKFFFYVNEHLTVCFEQDWCRARLGSLPLVWLPQLWDFNVKAAMLSNEGSISTETLIQSLVLSPTSRTRPRELIRERQWETRSRILRLLVTCNWAARESFEVCNSIKSRGDTLASRMPSHRSESVGGANRNICQSRTGIATKMAARTTPRTSSLFVHRRRSMLAVLRVELGRIVKIVFSSTFGHPCPRMTSTWRICQSCFGYMVDGSRWATRHRIRVWILRR